MRAPRLRSPWRSIVTIWIAALPLVGAPSIGAAQTPATPTIYEATTRLLIFHKQIKPEAEPVTVTAAANAHAAKIVTTQIAECAIRLFQLQDLPSLKPKDREVVALAVADGISAIGKPSVEFAACSVVELTVRSTSAADAVAIVRAVAGGYEDYLRQEEAAAATKIKAVTETRDRLKQQCGELRRLGKTDEFATLEPQLREMSIDLEMLKLKARVGAFEVVELDTPTTRVAARQSISMRP
jgi:hypothetical protein